MFLCRLQLNHTAAEDELTYDVQYFSPVFENDTITGLTAHFTVRYPTYQPAAIESLIRDANHNVSDDELRLELYCSLLYFSKYVPHDCIIQLRYFPVLTTNPWSCRVSEIYSTKRSSRSPMPAMSSRF